jgi:hypothetical protein
VASLAGAESASLPTPPFTPSEKNLIAQNVYGHVWKQAMTGVFGRPAQHMQILCQKLDVVV